MKPEETISRIFYDKFGEEMNYGAQLFKVDLHVHTPSSLDQKYLKKKGRITQERLKQLKAKGSEEEFGKSVEEVAKEFVKRFKEENLDIVAFTDHNSPSFIDNDHWEWGTWYKAVREAVKEDKECHTLVLPGVEITADMTHILAISDDKNPEGEDDPLVVYKIQNLLNEIGFKADKTGEFVSKVGGLNIYGAVKKIVEYGGIPIIAHIDGPGRSFKSTAFAWEKHWKEGGAKKGASEEAAFKFKYKGELEAILSIPELTVLEYVEKKNTILEKASKGKIKNTWRYQLQELMHKVKEGDEEGLQPSFAFTRSSDAHRFEDIAKRHSYVRMADRNFQSFFYNFREPGCAILSKGKIRGGKYGSVDAFLKSHWRKVLSDKDLEGAYNQLKEKKISTTKDLTAQTLEDMVVPDFLIEGMTVRGGLCNGAAHRFNPWVNCIAGGIGSGRTTRFESLRMIFEEDNTKESFKEFDTKEVCVVFSKATRGKNKKFYAVRCNISKGKKPAPGGGRKFALKREFSPLSIEYKNGQLVVKKEVNWEAWKNAPRDVKSFQPLFINGRDLYKEVAGNPLEDLSEEGWKLVEERINDTKNTMPIVIADLENCLSDNCTEGKVIPLLQEKRSYRQIIAFTTRPNIPVLLDAENIIIVNKGKTEINGPLENVKSSSRLITVAEKLQEALEGGVEAFMDRARRYSNLRLNWKEGG